MGAHFDATRRLAGPQDDRHGSALLGVVDVDRQEAALIIMRVEQRELLVAVDDVACVVDVKRDAGRLARAAVHPGVDQAVGQTDHVAQPRSILQPRQRRLGTQITTAVRQRPAGQFECGVASQMIEVVGVLVTAADRELRARNMSARLCTMRVGSRRSGNTRASFSAKPRRRSAIARSITPPFEVSRPPSKAAVIFLA